MQQLQDLLDLSWMQTTLGVLALLALAWLAGQLLRRLLRRLIGGIARRTATGWDDALLGYGTFRWLARALPALIIQYGIVLVPGVPQRVEALLGKAMTALVVLCVVMAVSAVLSACESMYQRTPRGQQRPIKGLLQLVKIGLFIVAGLVIIAAVTGKQVGLLLSGVGAMSAVLMLIFKDTILGFVAGVQLSSNDMLRVGDWIEMPQLNADGDVIDIALHTVKVRNWDKTITTIPSWRLISDSYKNWRGMQEIGGRRIKRALHLDAASVRFLDQREIRRLSRLQLLAEYLPSRERDVEQWNEALGDAAGLPANRRRLTNLGTFRAYVQAYLDGHPQIHHRLSCMVRQLASGPQGVPLELYCFTATVDWAEYEGIQADIFDHLFALLPEFGLALYQQPSGQDVRSALALRGETPAKSTVDQRAIQLDEA
ncbi:mechanosensitive ion channel family protein [Rhodanobacter sp. FDAARGOS 1247]|uniref:mechanosensitive ion channel family protein n=1 Tax=Rhodanobacter sp. FDAARGOS 1247 TaxID=2778082 RepID=UPI0019517AAA|nr:mechanosensitive ion channel domain-containing protein [Rhodanobacter sp. FDAARGOS 1247]QRP63695.1 mechanosensitive ion channel family protein [Rhodanobacter sp. FDAARGOS 1247]